MKYAQGMDAALYKMEWGRLQPESAQIIVDQQRRFADYLDSSVHHVYTDEQRDKIGAIAQAAKVRLDDFRHSDPHDEVMNAKMRDLHIMVNNSKAPMMPRSTSTPTPRSGGRASWLRSSS